MQSCSNLGILRGHKVTKNLDTLMTSNQPASEASALNKHSQKNSAIKRVKVTALVLMAFWFLLYLVIWVFSPMAVKRFAVAPLQQYKLSLDPQSSIRFNPFTSTLSVDDLTVLDAQQNVTFSMQEAEISLHLHRLLASQLYVSEFTISNVMLNVEQSDGRLLIAGADLFAQSTEQAPAQQVTNQNPGEAQTSSMRILIPELGIAGLKVDAIIDGVEQQLLLSALNIEDASVSQGEQALTLKINALVNQAPLTISADMSLRDQIGTIATSLSLSEFDLASVSPLMEPQSITLEGLLSIDAAPTIVLAKETVAISNENLQVLLNQLALETSPWLVTAQSNMLKLNDLSLISSLRGEVISATGVLTSDFQEGNVSIAQAHNSAVNWQGIQANSRFELNGLSPEISIPELAFSGLNLSQDHSLESPISMLALGELTLSDIQATDKSVFIERIAIAGLKSNVEINSDKSIKSLLDTSALSSDQTETLEQEFAEQKSKELPANEQVQDTEIEPVAPAFAIKLNELVLLDKGEVQITDESVSPAFVNNLTIETLKAGPFDSQTPNAQSPFELLIIDPNYLKVNANGFVSPFADKLNAAINAKVNELNLPSVSPYVKDGLGFEMKSGQLDVHIDVVVSDDNIDGNTNLFLRGIEMTGADDAEQGVLSEGKAMPLNAALGVLKDDNGNIDLDVPLRGSVSDPSFGVESFFALVLKKAAMSQAQDYLMTTFVPYASVVSIALSGAEYLLKITLEPLIFDTEQSELPVQSSQFLSELALLMNDTPDLQVKTCAKLSYADLGIVINDDSKPELSDADKAKMLELGDARQANLKRYLVGQGIASNRVLHCASSLDSAEGALSRIELKTD